MDLTFSTPLKGNLVLCSDYRDAALHRSPGLYKFVWVRRGCLWLEVDHIPMELRVGMLLPLTPLHTLDVTRAEGEYLILAFDSNFYCIFGHDGEVSCSGLLFNGSSEVLRLELSEMRTAALQRVVDDLRAEYGVVDGLREEMLRSKTGMLMRIAELAGISGAIELEVIVNEEIRAARPIKLEDRVKYMTEKNPLIAELRKALDLEVE